MSMAHLIEEYKEVASNLRHYSNLRFANLTLFAVITAGLFSAVFQSSPSLQNSTQVSLKVLGILVVAFFAIIEDRIHQYWFWLHSRAKELEDLLEFRQYWILHMKLPPRALLSSRNAIRALLAVTGLGWLLSVFN